MNNTYFLHEPIPNKHKFAKAISMLSSLKSENLSTASIFSLSKLVFISIQSQIAITECVNAVISFCPLMRLHHKNHAGFFQHFLNCQVSQTMCNGRTEPV